MRVTIERSAFLKALNHVQSVVERRNTIPILSNVLVQSDKDKVRLTATDLDIEIVETVPAETARNGAATVPAHSCGPGSAMSRVRSSATPRAVPTRPAEMMPTLSRAGRKPLGVPM